MKVALKTSTSDHGSSAYPLIYPSLGSSFSPNDRLRYILPRSTNHWFDVEVSDVESKQVRLWSPVKNYWLEILL